MRLYRDKLYNEKGIYITPQMGHTEWEVDIIIMRLVEREPIIEAFTRPTRWPQFSENS